MKKSYYLIIILVIVATAGVYYFYTHKKTDTQTQAPQEKWYTYKNDELNINVSYPEVFQKIKITDEDKTSKIIYHAESSNPSSLMSLKYEERTGILKIAQKGTILDTLRQNFEGQYPKRYPDFKKQNDEKITIDGSEGADLYFTYLGTDNSTLMKQRLVIFTHDYEAKELGTVAFYFSFQSQESDFETMNPEFQKILESIKFVK